MKSTSVTLNSTEPRWEQSNQRILLNKLLIQNDAELISNNFAKLFASHSLNHMQKKQVFPKILCVLIQKRKRKENVWIHWLLWYSQIWKNFIFIEGFFWIICLNEKDYTIRKLNYNDLIWCFSWTFPNESY